MEKDIFEDTKMSRNGRMPLTKAVAESVLGESLDNVVMYDFCNNCVNKRNYNGLYVVATRQMSGMAAKFVDLCAKSSVIAGRVPVAVVAKTYESEYSMNYNSRGCDVAGNVIFYDPKTKKYSGFRRGWMPVCSHLCRYAASEQALYDVMNEVGRSFGKVESFAGQKIVVTQENARKTFWSAITDFVSKTFSK